MKKIIILWTTVLGISSCQNPEKKELQTLKEEVIMKIEVAKRNKNNTLGFLGALEDMNVDAVVNLFAEDGVHVNPYSSGIFPEGTKGHEGIRTYWESAFANFEKMEFPVDEMYAMEDPSITFIKFKGKVKLKNDTGWYNNNYYAIFKFNEKGKITEYIEIFNPIAAAKGFGLLDKIK